MDKDAEKAPETPRVDPGEPHTNAATPPKVYISSPTEGVWRALIESDAELGGSASFTIDRSDHEPRYRLFFGGGTAWRVALTTNELTALRYLIDRALLGEETIPF
ncbi:MAG: hypothetical protein H0U69_03580 [Trueperaceae bacterium]|nr:hypothetical protein [Trueperaceae bacterium]